MHRHDGPRILRPAILQAPRRQRQQPLLAHHGPIRSGEIRHSRHLHPLLLGDVGTQAHALDLGPAHVGVFRDRDCCQQYHTQTAAGGYLGGYCDGSNDFPYQFYLPV